MPPPEDLSSKKSHFDDMTHCIPDDCWYLVIDKLDLIGDQKSFGLTCHRFLNIQNSSRKRLELGFSRSLLKYYHAAFDNMFGILVKRFQQLEILCLGANHLRLSDSGLTSLQNYPSKLRVLYLANYTDVTDVGLAFIASGCQFLSVISLRQCSISDSGLEILTKSCKLLKEVDLCDCKEITDAGILCLNQNCRELRALNISGCYKIVGETFQGCSPELAYLEAKRCALHQTCVTGILSRRGIQYLSFSYLEYPLVMNGLRFAATLKSLNLTMCGFLDDIAIKEISKGCPLLEEWDVSRCCNIRLSGWESIGLHCQNLERLYVKSCQNFCDRGLQALADGCKRLTMIWMQYCHRVTQHGIHNFKIQRADVEIDDKKAKTIAPDWTSTSRFQLQP